MRSFDEYRARLLENFVILEREARHTKIARELDTKAQRLQGRVSRVVHGDTGLLHEVPDLVEYPSVVAGTFNVEFLELPEEVLATTLIHHQHYFPVESEDGRLKNAFLAVTNTEPDNELTIARNAERVVTARLRDARFFWEADRKATLESRIDRLGTLLFHKKLGSYKEKVERIAVLAEWIAREALGADDTTAKHAALAARLSKADLATDMVREFTELQGTMGGIYARHEGLPEEVWKAIYFHYLPVGVEAAAPPSREQLGAAATTWAAVSLADKLDTVVGLFAAGEKPTGSRDPYGVRRAAQGIVKILVDLPALGIAHGGRADLSMMIMTAWQPHAALAGGARDGWRSMQLAEFFWEREAHLFERRGYRNDEIRVVGALVNSPLTVWANPLAALHKVEAMSKARGSKEFQDLASLFKRVKNITKERLDSGVDLATLAPILREPAEAALLAELRERWPDTVGKLAKLHGPVDKFFKDVLVMADDPALREARLGLLTRLRSAVLAKLWRYFRNSTRRTSRSPRNVCTTIIRLNDPITPICETIRWRNVQ